MVVYRITCTVSTHIVVATAPQYPSLMNNTNRPGIQAFHVDNARKMVNLHTAGRHPSGRASDINSRNKDIPSKRPNPPTSKAKVHVPAKNHQGNCTNPQCSLCGVVIIPLPEATFPLNQEPSITVNDWSIYTFKGPILLLNELDELNEKRFDFPLPEMIFGNNCVRIISDKTGDKIEFSTLDALDSLEPHSDFKVSYHKEWLSTRPKAESTISECTENAPEMESVKPYDWTYSTNYKGTVTGNCQFVPTEKKIPIEKLLRPDPILFYDEAILFEDELGDNGIAMLSTKIRVMHSCLLLLCRFFLRVDDVVFRIRDTRVFVDFETNEVLREYKTQQASYEFLASKVSGRSADPKKSLRDAAWVAENMPVKSVEVEEMLLSKAAEQSS